MKRSSIDNVVYVGRRSCAPRGSVGAGADSRISHYRHQIGNEARSLQQWRESYEITPINSTSKDQQSSYHSKRFSRNDRSRRRRITEWWTGVVFQGER